MATTPDITDILDQISQSSGGGGGTSVPVFGGVDANKKPYVYMGGGGSPRLAFDTAPLVSPFGNIIGSAPSKNPVPQQRDHMVTLDEALSEFYRWAGTKKMTEWEDFLLKQGLIEEADRGNLKVLNDWWQTAVEQSVNFASAGRRFTPQDALKIYAAGQSSKKTAPAPSTRVQVDISNPTEAKALIIDAFQRRVGKDPTDAQIAELTASLQAAQRSNPTVATVSADGTSVSTSGGLNAQQFIDDKARSLPDYGNYQAATTYYNAYLDALKSPV